MLSTLAGAVRLASLLACLIVGVSFALFAIDQTGNASAHQQRKVAAGAAGVENVAAPSQGKEGSARKTIDEAAEKVTSPFSAITDGWHSEWTKRGTLLLLTLVIYGFGLGFIARIMRVRS